ncbi:hypothetical protein DFQ04_1731 [Algoriphagus boseongensis]|uniref:Uncharacterized protein n=1 Tax=Algoriphagus boseongensis TaxID=1442587 RepID=A0A4R6T5Z7_9BACT|nr:hypothetical protein [Algoriphagus boseongensis]TDQ17082.1 hypothetical protein DFQ04_1731 [Algoriphagus boseongensis]
MSSNDRILTPELVRILKIFLLSSILLVFVFSFFNSYRADNTQRDRTFQMADSDRLYFLNVRSIHYDREIRKDAGMTLFRHKKRVQSDSFPTLDPVIILNPTKEEAYIYFELKNADYPISLEASLGEEKQQIEFSNGNNQAHLNLLKGLNPWIKEDYEFELVSGTQKYPLWTDVKEKEILKTILEDYFRLLNQTN